MLVTLRHSRPGWPEQVVEVTVDRQRRTVRLDSPMFDAHLIGQFVVGELRRRTRGVVAYTAESLARGAAHESAPYQVLIVVAGVEFEGAVIALEDGGTNVVLRAMPRAPVPRCVADGERPDLVGPTDAAQMAGVTVAQLLAWTRARWPRVIGLDAGTGELQFPRWQFEPLIWRVVPQLAKALEGNANSVLAWLEAPLGAFQGLSPRQALEQGASPERVLAAADAAD